MEQAEMAAIPADFEWVAKRAKCTIGDVFKRLMIGTELDVNARKALLSEEQRQDHINFFFKSVEDSKFTINRTGPNICMCVEFVLESKEIIARFVERGEQILAATITLNDSGQCKLKVQGVELEDWQVRRRCLEDLFFNFR